MSATKSATKSATAAAPAAPACCLTVAALSPSELIAFNVLNSRELTGLPSASHLQNRGMSGFVPMARSGGNFTLTRLSSREMQVPLDAHNLAVWPLKKSYRTKIDILGDFLQRPEIEKEAHGLLHPLLRVSRARMLPEARQELVQTLYGHVKDPELRFRQFLCAVGMRSKIVRMHQKKDQSGPQLVYTWEFDPEGWNRAAYRLAPGCDSKGKPKITFA
jgi:hypothetical protein